MSEKFTVLPGQPGWEKIIRDLKSVPLKEWTNRFEEFDSLPFHEFTYEEIGQEYFKRFILLPWRLFPLPNKHQTFWRIRTNIKETENTNTSKPFSFPEPKNAPQGRANLKGHPVFYCSLTDRVAFFECTPQLQIFKEGYLSRWKLQEIFQPAPPQYFLPFMNFKPESPYYFVNKKIADKVRQFNYSVGGEGHEHLNILQEKFSIFFLHERYNLTSWISHRNLYEEPRQVIGIHYPSIQANHSGGNFAFHPELIESGRLALDKVFHFDIDFEDEFRSQAHLKRVGLKVNGNVRWREPNINDKVEFTNGY